MARSLSYIAGGEMSVTETYNGYWNPLKGDTKEPVQDVYHRYPTGKPAGILNEPLSGAYKVGVVSNIVQPEVNAN